MLATDELNPRRFRTSNWNLNPQFGWTERPSPLQTTVGPEFRPYQFLIHLTALVEAVEDPAVDQRSKKLVPLLVGSPGYW